MPSSFSDFEHLSSNPSIKSTVMALDPPPDGWTDRRIDKSNPEAEAEEAEAKKVEVDTTKLLRVNEPAVIKPSNRSLGTKNKKKRTRLKAFEDFIQRELSEFEHI